MNLLELVELDLFESRVLIFSFDFRWIGLTFGSDALLDLFLFLKNPERIPFFSVGEPCILKQQRIPKLNKAGLRMHLNVNHSI